MSVPRWRIVIANKSHFLLGEVKEIQFQDCQRFAVASYSLTLGHLDAEAPSTFAQGYTYDNLLI